MIKLLIIGRRRPGVTRAQAMHHLRRVHGPMVYDPPADAGPMPAHYVQNQVLDGVHLGGGAPYGIDRDFVTQIWFESVADMIASTQTPYYLANLKPDEPRFVDEATLVRCVVSEGSRQGGAGGVSKLFVFLKATADADRQAVTVRWREAMAPALASAGAGWVENTVTERPGEHPFAHTIWEAWFEDRNSLTAFADDRLPALLDSLGATLDRGASLYLLAEEYTVKRLRTEA